MAGQILLTIGLIGFSFKGLLGAREVKNSQTGPAWSSKQRHITGNILHLVFVGQCIWFHFMGSAQTYEHIISF